MLLKPPRTLDEQVSRLQSEHGLIIEDVYKAKEILSRVNYYRLSAYGIGLKRSDAPERYRDGVSLEMLDRLYSFDSRLRSSLLHILEHTEIELRTQLAYSFSLRYGSEGYMDVSNFRDRPNSHGESVHEIVIRNFRQEVSRQKNLPFVRHHIEKYEGHFPLWVAVELFSFGMLSSLYSIMQPDDQKSISRFYQVKPHVLVSWMQSLVDVRNRCAHYGRIYNMPLSTTPFLFPELSQYRSNRIFPVILILHRLMKGKPAWNAFFLELEALMDEHCEIHLDFIGFPSEWKSVLEK